MVYCIVWRTELLGDVLYCMVYWGVGWFTALYGVLRCCVVYCIVYYTELLVGVLYCVAY